MAYATAEARQQLLDAVAEATDEIGFAIACLGAAYEQLDDHTAGRLEEELFGPVQRAYGRARRTHAEFAERYELTGRSFEPQRPGLPSSGARGFIDDAAAAAGEADRGLAALQDSPLWLEVGDMGLRAGLAEVRELLGGLPQRARELVRTLGR
jgi:hypothetical protein